MCFLRVSLFGAASLMLSACGGLTDLKTTMRDDHVSLFDHAAFSVPQETSLTRDAILLEERVRDVLKAAHGPAQGCSSMLGDPQMSQCSEGLLKGRWLGRLGTRGPIDAVAITPEVAAAHEQLAVVAEGAQTLLADQQEELVLLQRGQAEGTLDPQTLSNRLTEMRQSRDAVADALMLAAERSAKTGRALQDAQEDGQYELDFYVRAIRDIETRATAIAQALKADFT